MLDQDTFKNVLLSHCDYCLINSEVLDEDAQEVEDQ